MARRTGARTRTWHRQRRARDKAWDVIRVMRRFTLPELVAAAEIGPDNARKYCAGLRASGYLRVVQPKANGRKGGHLVYQLVRDTGPHAPRLQSDGTTYDPNLHRVYPGGIRQ